MPCGFDRRIDGVRDVTVDLPTGQVTVTGGRPLPADRIADAVRRAGYELTALAL
ncbi:heavy-metal-associated domain-containing protein [Planomonospora sp. ID67723]|uniref:heavy-metal-associated domain-containing protein n=1 Tax=Planomonospora sp. ID67723 TaxID=2738134 RepID=UPI0018C439CD|nr:heavy metal-associated domain-containing protein [Planomonospora sp. ID67723]MBG0830168.1 heavy-metal-associated domain-containing protein [Planomonospora sp. ID67723]